jgi:hypothetical protein
MLTPGPGALHRIAPQNSDGRALSRNQLFARETCAPSRLWIRGVEEAVVGAATRPARASASWSTAGRNTSACAPAIIMRVDRIGVSHPTDEQRKHKVGSVSDPWRAIDARLCRSLPLRRCRCGFRDCGKRRSHDPDRRLGFATEPVAFHEPARIVVRKPGAARCILPNQRLQWQIDPDRLN